MPQNWRKRLSDATKCANCDRSLSPEDQRILSVYNHDAICMTCKKQEEVKDDYARKSQEMIGQCMNDSELSYGGEAEGYCYFHFYPC